jgi:hypothetical protein
MFVALLTRYIFFTKPYFYAIINVATLHVVLVHSGHHYRFIECNLFSPWYRWNIAHVYLINNHPFTHHFLYYNNFHIFVYRYALTLETTQLAKLQHIHMLHTIDHWEMEEQLQTNIWSQVIFNEINNAHDVAKKYISLTVINSRFIFPDFYSIVHMQSIMVFTFLISRWRSLVIKF